MLPSAETSLHEQLPVRESGGKLLEQDAPAERRAGKLLHGITLFCLLIYKVLGYGSFALYFRFGI